MPEKLPTPLSISRFRGCLLGLAVGDAIGTSVEFMPPGSFTPLTDMIGGGPFRLKPGEWTDDTSMALCLAESLLEKGGFDPIDQLERYARWYRTGYLSSNGRCFDIGITTASSLHRFERTHEPFPGSDAPNTAGNGSLMRIAPVPMYYVRQAQTAIEYCAASSRTTHANIKAVDACRYYGALILGALKGYSKEALLSPIHTWQFLEDEVKDSLCSLTPDIQGITNGSFKHKSPPDIRGDGYVVRGMEAALWAFYTSDSFEVGVLKAVNLGEDADTTAAIYGQLAGAYYGEELIPLAWRTRLAMVDKISHYADKIWEAALTY